MTVFSLERATRALVDECRTHVNPYKDLLRSARYGRLTVAGDVLGAVLGQPCAIKPGPHGTLTVSVDTGATEAENEAVDILRWMRKAHASVRSTRRLRRSPDCRWLDVLQKRWELTPYGVKGVVVDAGGGPDRVAAVADLKAIIDTMIDCARLERQLRAEGDIRRDGGVLVIIAYDGCPFHKTSATRCDVYVDVWANPAAPALSRSWATWWVFDGADDAKHLTRMDTVAGLTAQVRSLEGGAGYCVQDEGGAKRHYPYLCALTGDGKAMAAGNPKKGCRCWVCDRMVGDFNTAFEPEDQDTGARFGAIAAVIPTSRRIGDNSHCAARCTTAVVKRLQAAATAHSQTAGRVFRAFVRDLKQEALRVPVADRVRKTSTKEHTVDITTSLLLLRDAKLQQQLLDSVATGAMGTVQWDGTDRWLPVHRVVKLLLDALVYMNRVWRQRCRVSPEVCQVYADRVAVVGGVWRTLKWTVPTWVHWVLVHSTAVLRRWGGLFKFSSIPSEFRNQGFKMDVRHCYQGWKLSKPYMTTWGLKQCIHLDALDWGLRRYFGERFGEDALAALDDGMVRKRVKRDRPGQWAKRVRVQ